METIVIKGSQRPQFAVIQFDDNKIDIIRSEQAFYDEKGKISSAIFPDVILKKELESILKNNDTPDESWYNESGYPYAVIRHFGYASEYKLN